MNRTILLPMVLALVATMTVHADNLVLITKRPTTQNFTANWSQLGIAGTPVIGPFSMNAGPITINGTDSSAAVIEQEGNGFLGDFTKGDFVIETLFNLGVLSLHFSTGISQAGAQFQPCDTCSSTFPIQAVIVARDVNHNSLGSFHISVFNDKKEDGSAPYIGIQDLTGANIYYIDFEQGFDTPWAINELSITAPTSTPCPPPNTQGASYLYGDVFALCCLL